MGEPGYNFDKKSAVRIAKAVKAVENLRNKPVGFRSATKGKYDNDLVAVKNTSGGTIPQYALVKLTYNSTLTLYELSQCDSDEVALLGITTESLANNEESLCWIAGTQNLLVSAYSGLTVGGYISSQSSSWYGMSADSGPLIYVGATEESQPSGLPSGVGLVKVKFTGGSGGSSLPTLYKAIADESGGTIQAKPCNSTGTVTGDAVELKVLP